MEPTSHKYGFYKNGISGHEDAKSALDRQGDTISFAASAAPADPRNPRAGHLALVWVVHYIINIIIILVSHKSELQSPVYAKQSKGLALR